LRLTLAALSMPVAAACLPHTLTLLTHPAGTRNGQRSKTTKQPRHRWIGIIPAFAGLILLSADEGLELVFGIGESLTLGVAVACALHIVLLGRWAPRTDPLRLAFVQILVIAALCFAAMMVIGEPFPPLTPTVIGAAVELGVIGMAFIFAAMNGAQQSVSPARATMIYATAPVWAACIGMLTGQWLTGMAIAGALLIVFGGQRDWLVPTRSPTTSDC
jgi:drug/metabolite transporter (DMT)-like permease